MVEKLLQRLEERFHRRWGILEGRRSRARQNWLWKLGREYANPNTERPDQTVTDKDGFGAIGKHQLGFAVDVWPIDKVSGRLFCPPLEVEFTDPVTKKKTRRLHEAWAELRDVCRELGLRWGGSWKDAPHVERARA